MARGVGRIDRSMTPRGASAAPGHDQAGLDAFHAALTGHTPAAMPDLIPDPMPEPARPLAPDPPEFLEILPRPQMPVPEPLPWQAPSTINTVRQALQTMSGLDRFTARRLLARFGGTLDAGQLAYVLDSSATVAQGVVDLLDEVGDGRLGAEELDPDSIAAALAGLDAEPD